MTRRRTTDDEQAANALDGLKMSDLSLSASLERPCARRYMRDIAVDDAPPSRSEYRHPLNPYGSTPPPNAAARLGWDGGRWILIV
ncbi:hypothetical protein GQ602_002259 [Ophiocordyceps camponoti-floridani]|uniref:Uncharacterized protein n=1 Tax=Ophiocordyceps camponoti-floridani TaxID=2030778 RepID=A0A8H4QA63_9HYPO|nr:hypothetical protein GQ602_002259 [Ophiocordyceps camponoti-floridani]